MNADESPDVRSFFRMAVTYAKGRGMVKAVGWAFFVTVRKFRLADPSLVVREWADDALEPSAAATAFFEADRRRARRNGGQRRASAARRQA